MYLSNVLNPGEVFIYIFFFMLIIIGAYYSAKLISKKTTSLYGGKNIKIIERINIDKDKSFVLLKKGRTIYLVGVSSQGMTVIDTYEDEEVPAEEESGKVNKENSFESILMKFFKRGGGGKNE